MEFDPSWDVKAALQAAEKEKVRVELWVRGGGQMTGVLGSVSDHHCVLTHLMGKDFFDALVKIDDIAAVVAQIRKK